MSATTARIRALARDLLSNGELTPGGFRAIASVCDAEEAASARRIEASLAEGAQVQAGHDARMRDAYTRYPDL